MKILPFDPTTAQFSVQMAQSIFLTVACLLLYVALTCAALGGLVKAAELVAQQHKNASARRAAKKTKKAREEFMRVAQERAKNAPPTVEKWS